MCLDILSQYLEQRAILSDKLNSLLRLTYSRRNRLLVEVLSDEICDLDFVIAEMRKAYSRNCGYRPRRDTLHRRPDSYQYEKIL